MEQGFNLTYNAKFIKNFTQESLMQVCRLHLIEMKMVCSRTVFVTRISFCHPRPDRGSRGGFRQVGTNEGANPIDFHGLGRRNKVNVIALAVVAR